MDRVARNVTDYHFEVWWNTYEGMWIAQCTVPDAPIGYLNDCGNTPQDAIINLVYILRLHLDQCQENLESK